MASACGSVRLCRPPLICGGVLSSPPRLAVPQHVGHLCSAKPVSRHLSTASVFKPSDRMPTVPSTPDPSPCPEGAPVIPDYYSPSHERLVTLCSLPPLEAELARAKLEARGIKCFVIDHTMASTHPFIAPLVRLQVAEADLNCAHDILAEPSVKAAEGEYVDEPWRCPMCHRKSIELMPLPPRQRLLRISCVLILFLPVLMQAFRVDPRLELWLYGGWIVVVAGLLVVVTMHRRGRLCTQCGWQAEQG